MFATSMLALVFAIHALWIPAKAWLSQQLIHHSWQQFQLTGKPLKPWPWADTHAIAALSFERIQKDMVVLNGGDATSLAFSASAVAPFNRPNISLPFVVAGHRDSHFSFLSEVYMEDIISLTDKDGRGQLYIVEAIDIVDASTNEQLTVEEESLVLITCYPFNDAGGESEQRYVIKARRLT